jgi:hypothetical protein
MNSGIRVLFAVLVACVAAVASPASAAEIEGIKLEEMVRVANHDLKLHGAGIRYRKDAKVLVVGLYLAGRYKTTQDILAAPGPKRVALVMLQDLDTEKFVRSYIAGMQANADKAEKMDLVYQFVKFGEICASVGIARKGDAISFDWIPGSGMHVVLNGKKIGEPLAGEGFYRVFLKFLLGDVPADEKLKQRLLSGVT